jgi:two-component system sensor histidine kinase VicK
LTGKDALSIPDLLSALLRPYERSLEERGVRIVRQIDPTTPDLDLDPDRVRQVAETLLAEAAAGTVDGGRVRVCLKHSLGTVMISIKDQGAGLAPGEWERRLEDPARGAVPGAPLTLAACRDAVASLDGHLFANSREGKGSTYYVVLPVPGR